MAGEALFFWLGASAGAETGHSAEPEPVSRLGPSGECPARIIWSDEICDLIDDAFATVSRNPSDHEVAVAYRTAIVWALEGGRAPNRRRA